MSFRASDSGLNLSSFFLLLLFIRILIARATSFFHVTYGEKAHFDVFVAVLPRRLFPPEKGKIHSSFLLLLLHFRSRFSIEGIEKVCLLFAYDLFKRIIQLFFFLLHSPSFFHRFYCYFSSLSHHLGCLLFAFLILISPFDIHLYNNCWQ